MTQLSSRFVSNIYNEFKDLTGAEPRELARFYEKNKSQIQNLDIFQYFDLQVLYLTAIYELGSYQKLLDTIDEPIETSIIHSIKEHNSKDVFHKLLYMKGESLYQLMHYDKAKYVFLELLKMDNGNSYYKEALSRTYRKMVPHSVKRARALSILLFIISAMVIAIEVLAIKHFFASYAVGFEIGRNILFGLGWATLIGSELFHYYRVQSEIAHFIKK